MNTLSPHCYTANIYIKAYIVFLFPFIRLYYLPSCLWNYDKVLIGVYLSNHLSENVYLWTIIPKRVGIHIMTSGSRPLGGAVGKNLGFFFLL